MRWREENGTIVFIPVHSITKLHSFYQDNLSLVSTIFKSFTNHTHQDYTFEQRNTQDFWVIKKSSLTPCKNHNYRPKITLGKQPKAQELQNLMVALPSQPCTSSSS